MECPNPAKLTGSKLDEIKKLEEKLGVILVAYDRVHLYKKLSKEALSRIQAVEKDTGSILIAYEA